jgi:hypothetical protein
MHARFLGLKFSLYKTNTPMIWFLSVVGASPTTQQQYSSGRSSPSCAGPFPSFVPSVRPDLRAATVSVLVKSTAVVCSLYLIAGQIHCRGAARCSCRAPRCAGSPGHSGQLLFLSGPPGGLFISERRWFWHSTCSWDGDCVIGILWVDAAWWMNDMITSVSNILKWWVVHLTNPTWTWLALLL